MATGSTSAYSETKFYLLLAIFAGVWGMLPMLTIKLVPLDLSWLGLGVISFSYGAFTHAITFPCTDAVCEVWGARRARLMVYFGFLNYLIATGMVFIATLLPASPFWAQQNEGYVQLFSLAPRLVIASTIASIVSQLADVYLFQKIKEFTGERHLWIRNNGGILVSQFLDTSIFYSIAFYGVLPTSELPKLVIGTFLVKLVLSPVSTPFVYLTVYWITGRWTVKCDLATTPVAASTADNDSAPTTASLASPASK